jgi:tRNA-uridine 2-sulfurtransferase
MSEKVFVAMSGGVDSSLSALLLKQAGYEVAGIHLELFKRAAPHADDHQDLENTCRLLGIPLHYLHLEEEFQGSIVQYFCDEYLGGRTPNPCVLCNKRIKFGRMLEKVQEMGGSYLATGHYARIDSQPGQYRLLKGVDTAKDQSYFLYNLGQNELKRVFFPLGGMLKSQVKKLAAEAGLPAAVHKESQDICFIPDNDHQAFLKKRIDSPSGDIVDNTGKVVGKHQGLAYYTIGQRGGMGVSAAQRLYVVELDAFNNRLVIGPQELLLRSSLIAVNLNWVGGQPPQENLSIMAKVRYRTPEAEAVLKLQGERAEVVFARPQRAIAPGQSVVFYQGDQVLGGGIIEEVR